MTGGASVKSQWEVTANLTRDGTIILPDKLTLGGCEIADYEITFQTIAANGEEAEREAEKQFRAATSALIVATGRPFGFDVKSWRNLESGAGGGRLWHGLDFIVAGRLTDADIELAQEFAGLLRNIGVPPRRLFWALDELTRATEDTRFAFLWLNRCIEQVREEFRSPKDKDDDAPVWGRMRSVLNVSRPYLDFISQRRNNAEFDIAHVPKKYGPKSRVHGNDIHEGISRASEILSRFIKYLVGYPVGEKL